MSVEKIEHEQDFNPLLQFLAAETRTNSLIHATQAMLFAFIMLYVSRSIGTLSDGWLNPTVLAHCAVLVLISYPFQTVMAVGLMAKTKGRLPLAFAAATGCMLAALPISMLTPTMSWLLGILPVEGSVETRSEFNAYLQEKYPTILVAFVALGTVMWMSLCFRWWLNRFKWADERPLAGETTIETTSTEVLAADRDDDLPCYLMRKLPHSKRGKIIALSAEQHYVRVFTPNGNDLVLTSFSEAVASLPSSAGMRIHRSHWVCRDAIQLIKAEGSRLFVELKHNLEFPVSRSFSGAVREEFPELVT